MNELQSRVLETMYGLSMCVI